MKISFSKIEKGQEEQETFYVFDDENNYKLLGQAVKRKSHRHWDLDDDLCRVFRTMPKYTNHHQATSLRRKLKELAADMTSRQATVRFLGKEEYMDERPARGLEGFTTTALWAEIKHRLCQSHRNLDNDDDYIPDLERAIAEAPPFPEIKP